MHNHNHKKESNSLRKLNLSIKKCPTHLIQIAANSIHKNQSKTSSKCQLNKDPSCKIPSINSNIYIYNHNHKKQSNSHPKPTSSMKKGPTFLIIAANSHKKKPQVNVNSTKNHYAKPEVPALKHTHTCTTTNTKKKKKKKKQPNSHRKPTLSMKKGPTHLMQTAAKSPKNTPSSTNLTNFHKHPPARFLGDKGSSRTPPSPSTASQSPGPGPNFT
jgi:hypothetical protein